MPPGTYFVVHHKNDQLMSLLGVCRLTMSYSYVRCVSIVDGFVISYLLGWTLLLLSCCKRRNGNTWNIYTSRYFRYDSTSALGSTVSWASRLCREDVSTGGRSFYRLFLSVRVYVCPRRKLLLPLEDGGQLSKLLYHSVAFCNFVYDFMNECSKHGNKCQKMMCDIG